VLSQAAMSGVVAVAPPVRALATVCGLPQRPPRGAGTNATVPKTRDGGCVRPRTVTSRLQLATL
jgi:hypothetical protein